MTATTTLIGNTTSDIELRYTQAGKAVGNVTVAVSDRKFDKQTNQWVDGDVWFARCTMWGELAEHAAGSIPKGTRVVAFGRIGQRDWEDKDGQKRSSVEVTLDEIGASLRYATAQVTRTAPTSPAAGRTQVAADGEPWSTPGSGQADAWSTPGFDTESPF
jgi:single-strand DNA-binding protein